MDIVRHAAFCKAWPGIIDGVKLIGSIQVKAAPDRWQPVTVAGADSVPAIIGGWSHRQVIGPNGVRELKVETIPVGPGKTSLARASSSRRSPAATAGSFGRCYQRFTPRTEMDIAVVGVGINLTLDAAEPARRRAWRWCGRPTVLLVKECADALIGARSTITRSAAGGGRERGLPSDRRQTRNQGIPDQGCRRVARRTAVGHFARRGSN